MMTKPDTPTPAASGAAPADMRNLLQGVVDLAKAAHQHWDADREAKVGKILMALAGYSEGYDWRADALHAALASREAQQSPAPLTDERIAELWIEHGLDECDPEGFARVIEREVRAALASPQVADEDVERFYPDLVSDPIVREVCAAYYAQPKAGHFQRLQEIGALLRTARDAASPQVAPAPEPVSWQGRRAYKDEPEWGQWRDLHPDNVALWKEKAVEKPDMFQLRALYAAPVQVVPHPIGYAVERSAFRVSPHGQDAESREWLEFTDDPKEKGAFPVWAAPVAPQDDARDAARWRWLMDSEWEMFDNRWLNQMGLYGDGPEEFGQAIDTRIAAKGDAA